MALNSLQDKTAFITGGASGIGFEMARAFASQGAQVMLADIEEAPLKAAIEKLSATNAAVDGIAMDVSDRDAMLAAAARTVDRFGKVHIVCNNAGVGAGGPMEEIPASDWDWVIDVNLKAVAWGIEAFVPHIKRQGEGGHIVNTASMAGLVPVPGFGPYTATKYAVVGMSEDLAMELEPFGIGVSVLCPGFVKTRIAESRRTRGEKYGADAKQEEDDLVAGDAVAAGIPPEVVGERVAEAILANQPYIFTHPEFRGAVDERFAAISAGFDDAEKSEALKAVSAEEREKQRATVAALRAAGD